MSDETTKDGTIELLSKLLSSSVELKEYIEKVNEGIQNLNEARFVAMEKAVQVANTQMDDRLKGMSKSTDDDKKETRNFFTRDEFTSAHAPVLKDIEDLKLSRAALEGKASQKSVNVAYILAGIAIFLNILDFFFKSLKG
jgi:hypothetical protein